MCTVFGILLAKIYILLSIINASLHAEALNPRVLFSVIFLSFHFL